MVERIAGGVELEPDEPPAGDGRRRRHQQSHQHILHALAEALCEPDIEVTPEQIAARSGYSISTIFRHFGGRDGLVAAMQELVRSRVREHLDAGLFEGDVRARVGELVRRLAAVFETVAPLLRAVAQDRQRTLGDTGRRRLDGLVRVQIGAALAEELAALPADTADILPAVLSVAAWSHMRTTQSHSPERAAALLESAVLRLLGEGPRER
jgi:AcrR family transcriptional regulator